ncbi:MAG: HAMP domain-containing protein [Anaerolineae bacterium]|nr:HAMP domain-containing protein [Anaerolineae bacterium]
MAAQTRFISLQWRFLLPLFSIILIVAMSGAYFAARQLSLAAQPQQANLVRQSSLALSQQIADLYQRSLQEAQRIAFTSGIARAVEAGNASALQRTLEGSARLAGIDHLIISAPDGSEILGLLRVVQGNSADYSVSTGTEVSSLGAQVDDLAGVAALARTSEGFMLYTAYPILRDDRRVGSVTVGWRLSSALNTMQAGGLAGVAIFGPDASLLQTTFPAGAELNVTQDVFDQALRSGGENVPVTAVQLNGEHYLTAYLPFQYGVQTLGVLGVFVPNTALTLMEVGRQAVGLLLAALAAALVIGAFIGVNQLIVRRVRTITRTTERLTQGDLTARTQMHPSDEIGALGHALDRYATYVQERQDTMRQSLRRQRRETEHLTAVLEALPDGVVVLDADGGIVLLNEHAKILLGAQQENSIPFIDQLTAAASEGLGATMAPGIYALGDPQKVDFNGKMLSAQVAAVMNMADMRVGTVIVLRDITTEVRRQRLHERVIGKLEQDVQKPLTDAAQIAANQSLSTLSRELTRHAVTLRKLMVEMRDLNMPESLDGRDQQRAILLDTLIWSVANEWRQIAAANNLRLDVMIEQKGLHVLGDERRLRWAIGNIVDNAIKYTPPGGKLTLEVQGETQGRANLRVRDNGVGIAPEELPHIFTRFYRGTPTTSAGRVIHVPGSGQGLALSKQIVESHGGQIQVKSKVGVGTAVYFSLPVTAPVSMPMPQLQVDLDGETMRLDVAPQEIEKP